MAGKMRENEATTSTSGSSSSSRGETAVEDWGRHRSSCGYCRSTARTSVSHGLWAHSVTVDDYQDLLDRGWRRSGSFLYKPEMEKTCCPSYTIRLKASDFVPSKEQLRVRRRMQRFLDGTLDAKQSMEVSEDPSIQVGACNCSFEKVSSSENKKAVSGVNQERNEAGDVSNFLSDQIDNVVCTYAGSWKFPCNFQLPKASVKKVSQSKRKLLVEGAEDLIYSSNIAFQMAAIARRAQSSMKDAGKSAEDYDLCPKAIAEKLAAYLNELSTKNLLIRACNGHINFYAAAAHGYHSESNQMVVSSNESASGCKKKDCRLRNSSKHPQGKRKRLEIHLKRSSFDPEEFSLYKRYQLVVHNDTPDHVTESSYRRFLVDTPLVFVPPSNDGRVPPCGFGSFHQQYVIDGQLVAVGVVDILPKCLSSKYLFWDPDFAFLSLGKYSALQEIGWVKENQVHCPSLQYYYLGYYIHSCNKMRYKASYRPSELLCPRHYQWVQFGTARPLLDRKPYVVLSDHVILQNEESLQPLVSESDVKVHDNDNCYEDLNDAPMVEDEEMIELEYESSDDGSSPETDDQSSDEIENGAVHDILIGLKGSRMRYKDLLRSFGPDERSNLESQLCRYQRAVVAKRSSMFNDPTIEIQELTALVKNDIKALNTVLADLQTLQHIEIANGSYSEDRIVHSTAVCDDLKSKLMGATKKLQDVLTTRTENIKAHENRKQMFSTNASRENPFLRQAKTLTEPPPWSSSSNALGSSQSSARKLGCQQPLTKKKRSSTKGNNLKCKLISQQLSL